MKRAILYSICLLTLVSCSRKAKDSDKLDAARKDSLAVDYTYTDSGNTAFAKDILSLMKAQDFVGLAEHIHPDEGVRFSPYGTIDTLKGQKMGRGEFLELINDSTGGKKTWGSYDGSGFPIELTWKEYFGKFVYNVDFQNAPKFTVNGISSRGNSINNIDSVFSGHQYTESYFPGMEEKFSGLDWMALRLVFKVKDGRLFLVGIVHDQWTS